MRTMPIDRDDADERRARIDQIIEETRTKAQAAAAKRVQQTVHGATQRIRTAKAQLRAAERKKPADGSS